MLQFLEMVFLQLILLPVEGFTYLINESIAIINFICLYACIYRILPITNPKLFSLFEMGSHQRYTFFVLLFVLFINMK